MIPDIVKRMVDFTSKGDGTIISTSTCLESEAIAACNHYIPITAPGAGVTPRAWQKVQLGDGPIKSFLDQYAENEVLFISFGWVYCQSPRKR